MTLASLIRTFTKAIGNTDQPAPGPGAESQDGFAVVLGKAAEGAMTAASPIESASPDTEGKGDAALAASAFLGVLPRPMTHADSEAEISPATHASEMCGRIEFDATPIPMTNPEVGSDFQTQVPAGHAPVVRLQTSNQGQPAQALQVQSRQAQPQQAQPQQAQPLAQPQLAQPQQAQPQQAQPLAQTQLAQPQQAQPQQAPTLAQTQLAQPQQAQPQQAPTQQAQPKQAQPQQAQPQQAQPQQAQPQQAQSQQAQPPQAAPPQVQPQQVQPQPQQAQPQQTQPQPQQAQAQPQQAQAQHRQPEHPAPEKTESSPHQAPGDISAIRAESTDETPIPAPVKPATEQAAPPPDSTLAVAPEAMRRPGRTIAKTTAGNGSLEGEHPDVPGPRISTDDLPQTIVRVLTGFESVQQAEPASELEMPIAPEAETVAQSSASDPEHPEQAPEKARFTEGENRHQAEENVVPAKASRKNAARTRPEEENLPIERQERAEPVANQTPAASAPDGVFETVTPEAQAAPESLPEPVYVAPASDGIPEREANQRHLPTADMGSREPGNGPSRMAHLPRMAQNAAWVRALMNQEARTFASDDGWKVLEMKLEEDRGTMTIKARRDEGQFSVSVGFSDPALRSLAQANAPQIREALQVQYDSPVEFSLSGGEADSGSGQSGNGALTEDRHSGRGGKAPARTQVSALKSLVTGALHEWIG